MVVRRSSSLGTRYSSATGNSRRFVRSVAPSASSAAATSEGCAEAQKSLAKIACSRCSPSCAKHSSPPWRRHGHLRRQYQQRVDCRRLPPIEPMFRSCGLAASRHASRSAAGTCGSHSSSASVAPAPMRVPPPYAGRRRSKTSIPRGTTLRMSTSASACSRPARTSGTTSVPPCSGTAPSVSVLDARWSCSPLTLLRFLECPEHLLACDRQLVHLCAGGVANRVGDRRRRRDDRRLAEALRAEVRQVRVGLVDQLADDLGDVGDRRQLVRVEARREDLAGTRVVQPLL